MKYAGQIFPAAAASLALALAAPQPAFAHGAGLQKKGAVENEEKGPDGGQVVPFGKHHLEMVVTADEIVFKLLDENLKAVSAKGLAGSTVYLMVPGQPRRKLTLELGDEAGEVPHVEVKSDAGKGSFEAVVSLKGDGGKRENLRFHFTK